MTLLTKNRVFGCLMLLYLFCIQGTFYNILNEPPSIGQKFDETIQRWKPEVILAGQLNQQYVIEGCAAAMFICSGTLGFIALDYAQNPLTTRKNRLVSYLLALFTIIASIFGPKMFMKIKMRDYLLTT